MVGKNYAYQMSTTSAAFFDEDVQINPFIGAGAAGQRAIDEFNSDHFDHAKHGFIGGSLIVMAIVGGAVLTPLMGLISQTQHSIARAYMVPLLCYCGIALYSFVGVRMKRRESLERA